MEEEGTAVLRMIVRADLIEKGGFKESPEEERQ